MKRVLTLIICLCLALSLLSACGTAPAPAPSAEPEPTTEPAPSPAEPAEQFREFTDDCGRTVEIPVEVSAIAVSGPLSQIYIYPLCSDLMVGYANEFSVDAQKYIPKEFLALPPLGQLYGGKGTMDLEALLAAAPEVVIDVGEAKGTIVEDMDALTEQTGIPFVHIDATVETAADAYLRLGELVGREEKAEQLSQKCAQILENIQGIMAKVDADNARKTIVYCLGDKGLNVLAEGSYHADTLSLVATNAAVVAEVVSSGLGNEVDMEQLILWNPDFIVFAPDSIYETVFADPVWQQLDAISAGNCAKTPALPYGWLASPPSVQRYLGLMWLTAILYPGYVDYDLEMEVVDYYSLFYGYDLRHEEYLELTAFSFPG